MKGIEQLDAFTKALRALSKVPSKCAKRASTDIAWLMDKMFTTQTDPYGKPWQPLTAETIRRKHGDGRILQRAGNLRGSIDVKPNRGAGISITIGADYSGYHQTGTRYMPARKLFPNNGIPKSWAEAIDDAKNEEIERELGDFAA